MTGKVKRYGFPYKGSKNRIAGWIVDNIPPGGVFVDLFCGGCAVTQSALMMNRWNGYIVNDINPALPELFFDAINGKFRNERRWISRDHFYAEKDSSAYIAVCWSFGNNMERYLYNREIEDYKKALWYVIVFGDYSLFREFYPLPEMERSKIRQYLVKNKAEIKQSYIEWYKRKYFALDQRAEVEIIKQDIEREKERLRQYLISELNRNGLKACDVDKFLGTKGMAGHYYGKSQWEFPTHEVYQKLEEIMHWSRAYPITYYLAQRLESLDHLESLQSLERLQRLDEPLERLQNLQSLEQYGGDYRTVPLPSDAVIYCDIPYIGTDGYGVEFNHEEFYEWVRHSGRLTIISEYEMPEDFVCVASVDKRVVYSSCNNSLKKKECLFVHERHLDDYNRRMGKLF